MTPRPRPLLATRAIGFSTAAAGVVMLTRPDQVLRTVAGSASAPGTGVVRVLGTRLALQGSVLGTQPSSGLLLLAGTVDLLHACSMVALAAARPDRRRAATASAGLAAVTGSLSVLVSRRMARTDCVGRS